MEFSLFLGHASPAAKALQDLQALLAQLESRELVSVAF